MTTETKTLKLTKAQSELIESLKAQAEAAEHHPGAYSRGLSPGTSSAGRRDRAGEEAIAAQICAALNSKQPSTLEALSQLVDASYTEATRAWQEAGETGAMGYYRGRRAAFGEIKAELDRLIAAGSKADGT